MKSDVVFVHLNAVDIVMTFRQIARRHHDIFKEIFRGSVSVAGRIFRTDAAWLEEPGTAMLVLAILGVFLDFALDYLLLLSAFRSTDRSIIEAAEIDGATKWQLYWDVVLPLARPLRMSL